MTAAEIARDSAQALSSRLTAEKVGSSWSLRVSRIAFAIATTDEAAPPVVTAAGGELSGNLAAFAAYYAGQTFNQGAPKPDGSVPGLTTPTATGTIDDDTGAYDLTWASQIVGGSFNDFTGVWHLEGTFTASG